MQTSFTSHPSSYRDPSGFLFYHNGVLYRQVNQSFKKNFDHFISGGLYQHLVEKKILITHSLLNQNLTGSEDWYQTLKPGYIPFISYPYEWCFNMLKDGALITLEACREAMKYGMILKDASAYNVQWHEGKMIFIDTLSFERYEQQTPWIAYRQFCEHFLSSLALMHFLKYPLQNLLIAYPDGLPVGLVGKLLPWRSKLNLNIFLHIHLHGSIAKKQTNEIDPAKPFSSQKMENLLRSLEESIRSFSLNNPSGVWSTYYEEVNQRENYLAQKKQVITDWINEMVFQTAIDIGANEGTFSELLADKGKYVISADLDHYSINKLYNRIKEKRIGSIHPIIIDFANPSPALGVNNEERQSFLDRTKTDLVMALAVIHHLAIGKNIPFEMIASMFRKIAKLLIIEFIPKEDEKISLMLQQKKDVYDWYTKENFLIAFSRIYKIEASIEIGSSKRILYLMKAYEG